MCNFGGLMKIYMIGIGGVSMSAIAKHLLIKGFFVSGSDKQLNNFTNELEKLGAKIYNNNLIEVENADVIIYNSAISEDNLELTFAKKLNKAIFTRAEVLSKIISSFTNSIGVSGSHGKTTVTAMISNIYKQAGLPFTTYIGGEDVNLSNFYTCLNSKTIISEICEYKKNILNFKVNNGVVLNVDNDHLDSYDNITDLKNAFVTFLNKSNNTFINADDLVLSAYKNATTFAINSNATFRAVNLKNNDGFYSFNIKYNGENLCYLTLKVAGLHNVYNALASFSVAYKNKIKVNVIKKALENFTNVKRRNEFLFTINKTPIYADYCHHPTEIKNLIDTVNLKYKRALFIFQPHTYSRTKILFNDFVNLLKDKNVVFYKTYPAREKFNYYGGAYYLSLKCNKKPFFNNFNNLINYLKNNNKNYDAIYVLGAGNLYDEFIKYKNKARLI